MGPGEALCGIPAGFPSMPLASESTEADENSPDTHSNSNSTQGFVSLRASMSLPLKETPAEPHFSSGRYQETSWSAFSDRHSTSCHFNSNGVQAISPNTSSPPRTSASAIRSAQQRSSQLVQNVSSPEGASHSAPNSSSPQIVSCAADDSASDDGVAVYIDETDEDTNDGLLITECRISSRKAAEIRAFKAQWVQQMLMKKEQLLNSCLAKGAAVAGRRRTGSTKETRGHEPGGAGWSGSGAEFLGSKLRAFAACMMPEALECISRNSKRWVEASTDTSDSDSAQSLPTPSSCSRRRHSKAPSTTPHPFNLRSHTTSNLRAPKATAEVQPQGGSKKTERQQAATGVAADVALQSWGRFLRYIRRTCRVLPPRQRIERKAGLESDDDDEQAPLYMCRPGSVQRPSPLISHSLTEHLKASGTMFFKQFRRQCLPTAASVNSDASRVERAQEQQPCAMREDSVSAAAVPEFAAGESAAASSKEQHDDQDSERAVPLYEITAETSTLFGDMMRLEDTARMLDASCTFRLPAAPSSIVLSKNWMQKTGVDAAHKRSSDSPSSASGAASCAAAAAAAPTTAATPRATASSQPKRRGHVTLYTSPHAATATALSQLIVNCQAEGSLGAHVRQHMPCSAAAGVGHQPKPEGSVDEKAQEGDDTCVVYTVQADEDTLALSGLDAEYCARVESASRGMNRAAASLAHLESMHFNGGDLQGSATSAPMRRKKRKAPVVNNWVSSDDEDSGSERSPIEEEAPGEAYRREEANHQRSLMVDKLMLAHLMPYLPQSGPP
ncbi:hypothetical protein, conserved [Eimeria brunetti]|uniref:Uncharacterized protein n=1 Tax=Eimeria brunetti TaxID=51314 RepID=U6L805_9EIME|nr:hypothetical protein, conserved [Eimeria brunetti]